MIAPALPRPLVWLGLAGLLPQALCLASLAVAPSWQWVALAAGCFYAAIILSFLGGLWWMAGLLSCERRAWIYGLAVVPSLAGWAALLPWLVGWPWPGPSLLALGLILLASPLADAVIARRIAMPAGWLGLRVMMALGLGLLTLGLAMG
ncbi:MAG TPA: DUF3429 domain-containing protein [Novosphingobium sp.]|nr:DUF3429 domain-containing protein [Novosphingobium sp.]